MKIYKIICLFITGIACGWLVGMSVSPVLQTVLTAIITLLVSIVTVIAGLTANNEGQSGSASLSQKILVNGIDPLPLMFVVLAIALGSAGGVFTRTHHLLGTGVEEEIKEWKATGMTETEIAKLLFAYKYGNDKESKTNLLFANPGLFTTGSPICNILCGLEGNDLVSEINRSPNLDLQKLLKETPNLDSLSKKINSSCKCDISKE